MHIASRRTLMKHRSAQSGVALVVVLIFMLALAGIAIVSAKSALMGEAVARNQLDIQVARQAAEAALRDAEADILQPAGVAPAGRCSRGSERPAANFTSRATDDCIRGQCASNVDTLARADYAQAAASNASQAEAWWSGDKGGRWGESGKPAPGSTGACAQFTGGVPLGMFTGAAQIAAVSRQPEYLLEAVGVYTPTVFRITARGFGYRIGTEVVMQSYFQLPPIQ